MLFADLVGFTGYAERSSPSEVAAVLGAYWGIAAPLITRQFGGEVEKFIGDGIMATFNGRGDQPDHARRASCAALALQRTVGASGAAPRVACMRVGVNSGGVTVREIGSDGHVAYPSVGDTVNTGRQARGTSLPVWRRSDRAGDVRAAAQGRRRRSAGGAAHEGQGGRRRRIRPSRTSLLAPERRPPRYQAPILCIALRGGRYGPAAFA